MESDITLLDERKDGDNVVLTFDLSDKAIKVATELGIKLTLYCMVARITPEEAFELIWDRKKYLEQGPDDAEAV